jgi:hypothetical protein
MIIEENVQTVNKIETNYEFLSKLFLELLEIKPEFKTRFQAVAPEIYADIESASTNPNCSCRGKVEYYVNNNREKSAVFLNDFLRDNKYNIVLEEIENRYRFAIYHGKVEKVKISEWQEFSDGLAQKRAAYRAFSVSPIDSEYVNVFFL